jgi:hypothetical protein
MAQHDLSLRDLYRSLERPGKHPLKDAQAELDAAVQAAYNMPNSREPLEFLFGLNQELAEKEKAGQFVAGPGLPPLVKKPTDYITADCIHMP